MSLLRTIRSFIKDASLKSGIYDETFFNVYPYMYEPIMEALRRTLARSSVIQSPFNSGSL